jgi:hypothetical protein
MKENENDFMKFWFEDGILFSKFQKDTVVNLEAVKTTIELREKISVEKNQYWLFDITNIKSVTNEARQYGSKHGHNLVSACAVLVNSYFTKFLFTTYMKFNKPDFPFAFFANEEKAVEWLKELKEQNAML